MVLVSPAQWHQTDALAGLAPVGLTLDVTHRCPFRCAGCIEGDGMVASGGGDLSLGTIERVVDAFAAGGGEEVALYGGEPTIHPDFDAIVRRAAARVPRVTLITNGVGLARPRVQAALRDAARSARVRVRVSLNAGSAATHAELHGVPGAFGMVVEGMGGLHGSGVRLEVSFLVEERNAAELPSAWAVARDVGAAVLWPRPKTGVHGEGLVPLSPGARAAVLEGARLPGRPAIHLEPWYRSYLASGRRPDTAKGYGRCAFSGGLRLVVTPPDPGVVWACTYWRGDERFHLADLATTPWGSPAFEAARAAAMARVDPARDCAAVHCDRHELNRLLWAARHDRELAA